jgi:hypothetical protein
VKPGRSAGTEARSSGLSRVVHLPSSFTAPVRDVIRRESSPHFGAYPSLTDGTFLRTWRAGPQAGQPKL